MRSARGLASLVVDWCWKASHIGPSPLCDEFPHGRTAVNIRVEIAQYDLLPNPCGVEFLLCSFDQLVGLLPADCVTCCSLPSVQIDNHQRSGRSHIDVVNVCTSLLSEESEFLGLWDGIRAPDPLCSNQANSCRWFRTVWICGRKENRVFGKIGLRDGPFVLWGESSWIKKSVGFALA